MTGRAGAVAGTGGLRTQGRGKVIARQAPAPASGAFAGRQCRQAPACKLLTDEHGLWPLPNCEVVDHRLKISADTLKDLNYDDHGLAVCMPTRASTTSTARAAACRC